MFIGEFSIEESLKTILKKLFRLNSVLKQCFSRKLLYCIMFLLLCDDNLLNLNKNTLLYEAIVQ